VEQSVSTVERALASTHDGRKRIEEAVMMAREGTGRPDSRLINSERLIIGSWQPLSKRPGTYVTYKYERVVKNVDNTEMRGFIVG